MHGLRRREVQVSKSKCRGSEARSWECAIENIRTILSRECHRLAQTDGCGVCTAGKYNSEEGRSSCSICSNGKYSALQSETVGATGCTDCEAGKTR